ncbi:MAG: DNA recombination protein RmuC [Anaeromyxobacter sp.]|nr:DNA recombination protein RmuC [Anaeromyxobacter sp.]MBL0275249.1 DNA recombination protein RmuC [Anaeromyxobacter sp.]
MDVATTVVVALVFLAAGLGVGLWLRRLALESAGGEARRAADLELAALREQLRAREGQVAEARRAAEATQREAAAARQGLTALTAELAGARAELDGERRAAGERRLEAERTREQVRAEVEKLAGRVLDEKGKALLDRSQEGLGALLAPLRARLETFEAKVEKTYDAENRDRASLLEALRRLQETQGRLHEDAEALSRALTGESKAQGDWGELVLERVLETAGLTAGREYALQVSHQDEAGGRKQPDALVYLPGNRALVVDAKCSLTAFVEAARATSPEAREAALDAHLASVRTHVKGLAAKRYPEVVAERTVDLVLLFVPNEAAFHAALSRAPGLYEEAFRHRIVLCSPTTLLAALQLVAHVWRSEKQNANAQEIAEEAGKLLEKLAGFVADLDEVGQRLDQSKDAFDTARAKLATGKGNVLGRARAIAALGAPIKTERAQALLAQGADDEVEEAPPRPPR